MSHSLYDIYVIAVVKGLTMLQFVGSVFYNFNEFAAVDYFGLVIKI